MKLEVGKRYLDKAGRVCTVISRNEIGTVSFRVFHGDVGPIWHYEDGKANIDFGNYDLVAEIAKMPATKFKVGETYTARNGKQYKCINVNSDGSAHLASKDRAPAYLWDADGRSLSLSSEWDIVFPPIIETKHHAVTVEGKRMTIVYKVIDGVPDTDHAELVQF